MFMFSARLFRSAVCSLMLGCTAIAYGAESTLVAPSSPTLGTAVVADTDVERFILPDGTGLPDGNGDVITGQRLYQQHCLACHGAEGSGGINDALAGGHGSLPTDQPLKTIGSYWPYATTLFDYVRRAMPYPNPGSLTNDQTYSLTAYLLHINGIVPATAELNAQALSLIKMPNQQGFIRKF